MPTPQQDQAWANKIKTPVRPQQLPAWMQTLFNQRRNQPLPANWTPPIPAAQSAQVPTPLASTQAWIQQAAGHTQSLQPARRPGYAPQTQTIAPYNPANNWAGQVAQRPGYAPANIKYWEQRRHEQLARQQFYLPPDLNALPPPAAEPAPSPYSSYGGGWDSPYPYSPSKPYQNWLTNLTNWNID